MVTERVTKRAEKPANYEMVVVLSPVVVEDNLETAISNIGNFITSRGGTVSQQDRWGKRALAYPIKRSVQGTYLLTRFTLKPSASKELEDSLKINEQVLRHLLIKLEKEPAKKRPGRITPVAPAAPAQPAPAVPAA